MFLTDAEIATLTGRKIKRLQIEALRTMGVPFLVNACGKPVVTKAAIEGRSPGKTEVPKKEWVPAGFRRAA